jgi:hypothetical protein
MTPLNPDVAEIVAAAVSWHPRERHILAHSSQLIADSQRIEIHFTMSNEI